MHGLQVWLYENEQMIGPTISEFEGFEPQRLTWAVLLARWTEFARAAVALPDSGEPGLVRQSVTDIIALQAVWFALGHLEELEADEKQLGIDRAGVLIARHAGAVRKRFEQADQPLPEELEELLNDASTAYEESKKQG